MPAATLTRAARGRAKTCREIRTMTLTGLELRAAGGTGTTLTGFACVTEAPYQMQDWAGPYTEVVRAGAFTKTLAENDDVRLLFNHDGIPLARTKSGTLGLEEVAPGSERAAELGGCGLYCTAELDPASPLVQQIRSAMDRGDLDQMSFAFKVTRQSWSPDFTQRDILEVQLFDVAVVTYPANPATSAELRSAIAAHARSLMPVARVRAIAAEVREGKQLSASTLDVLQQVLDLIAAADEAVDEAQPLLADLMGVPNPDDDDEEEADDGDGASDDDPDALPDDDGSLDRASTDAPDLATAPAAEAREAAYRLAIARSKALRLHSAA